MSGDNMEKKCKQVPGMNIQFGYCSCNLRQVRLMLMNMRQVLQITETGIHSSESLSDIS